MKINKLRCIIDIIRPYKFTYLSIIIFTFLCGFLSSFNIAAMAPVLELILPASGNANNIFLGKMRMLAGFIPVSSPLIAACIFLLVVTTVSFMCSLLLSYLIGCGSSRILYNIKDRLFDKYSNMDYESFIEHKHGEIFYHIFSAPHNIRLLVTALPQLAGEFINILFLLGVLFMLNFKFTLFVIGFILIFNIAVTIASRKIAYKLGKDKEQLSLKHQVVANEFINGFKHIALYLARPRWRGYFDDINKKLSRIYLKENICLAVPKSAMEFSFYLFIIAVAVLVSNKLIVIKYLSGIAIYLAVCVRLLPSIGNVGRIRMTVMWLMPDAETIHNLLYVENTKEKNPAGYLRELKQLKHSIEFKDVRFSYKKGHPVLNGMNFNIDTMKTTAIVGVSGSGKTTIINLLLRLLEPQAGSILLDGQDIRNYDTQSWLKKISFVSQDPFIFHSTVKDNITFGDDRFSMDDIKKAARIAHADEFIDKLPDGYQTIVGEKGMKLSTGQQQRVSMARSILRDPDIFVFDEATNALDNISEEMIQRAISEIARAKTVIVVAHRFTTIKKADKIIVIKDGVKIEEGRHEDLIALAAHYKDIYSAEV